MMMMLLVIVGGWGRFCCRFLLLSWMRSGRALALLELGYVWLKHRNPAGKTWRLLHRSKLLWEQLVADLVAMLGFFCSGSQSLHYVYEICYVILSVAVEILYSILLCTVSPYYLLSNSIVIMLLFSDIEY
uniref:Uncharacterized protein n=1 Tax=Physcomitrium patens TaxID=3218 RepID=A0A2K1IHS0_PHYPA|nr:uncharacterized protein LOC112275937 isoform X1 [Physcomitrium patens]PNR28826.1 hypothetical protein PHYPA_027518 [Physcomitrium patens]|eukprot:XP_024362505.1 uncharacterized protein LOC112275937 isoform X1 [Physcomitrella patens]